MDGKGKLINADLSRFEGEFKEDKMHGFGVFKWKDGRIYRG